MTRYQGNPPLYPFYVNDMLVLAPDIEGARNVVIDSLPRGCDRITVQRMEERRWAALRAQDIRMLDVTSPKA